MELQNEAQGTEIDIKELIFLLLRKLWIIVLSGIVLAMAAFMISKYVTVKIYQSTTKVYVMNKKDDTSAVTYTDLQTGTQLTNDYKTLVTSRPVIEDVIESLNLNMAYGGLAGRISVSNPINTRILSITVSYPEPEMAQKIADAVRDASSKHISNVMKIEQVSIVEEANLPKRPSSPNVRMKTLIGGFIGMMLAAGIIILISILDDTIKSPDDIERYLGLSVLATIPLQKDLVNSDKKDKKLIKLKKSNKDKE